jgi:hypothetical protein
MAYEPCRYARRWPELFDQLLSKVTGGEATT